MNFKTLFTSLFAAMVVSFSSSVFGEAQYTIPNHKSWTQPQHGPEMCWAACNTMLLNAVGIPQTQEQQVANVGQQYAANGAGPTFLVFEQALKGSGPYKNKQGDTVSVIPKELSWLAMKDDPQPIVDFLKEGTPIIFSSWRHARIIYGAVLTGDDETEAGVKIQTLLVYDPGTDSDEIIDWSDVASGSYDGVGIIGFLTVTIEPTDSDGSNTSKPDDADTVVKPITLY